MAPNTASYLASLFSLSGRNALVTGGNSGLGEAIGRALARAGARVWLVARRERELADVVSAFREEGLVAEGVAADLTDRAALRSVAARIDQASGGVDILVNAAGINLRQPFMDVRDPDWDLTLAINLTAPFLLAQAIAPGMRSRAFGRIINVTSLQAARAFPNGAPYGASKGGLAQLTRAMAEAWSPHGITCNAIAPGFFKTALTAPLLADPARAAQMAAMTMIGRNGEPEDLAGAAVFLASPASAYVTGQMLFVDGGFSSR
jgi:NAD(P)-dependent dehydrogenase (short-subunit alcohol dehydrogenase family)